MGRGRGKKKLKKKRKWDLNSVFHIMVPYLQLIGKKAVHGEGELRTHHHGGKAHLVATGPETPFLSEAEKMKPKVAKSTANVLTQSLLNH